MCRLYRLGNLPLNAAWFLTGARTGSVASFKTALVVAGLPKTRSGKVLRGTMRKSPRATITVAGDD